MARFKIIPAKDIVEGKAVRSSPKNTGTNRATLPVKKGVDKLNPPIQFNDTSVYIGNIPLNTTERDPVFLFQEVGEVTGVRIPKHNGLSKGYAFIEFLDAETARKALQARLSMGGRMLVLRWASPRTGHAL